MASTPKVVIPNLIDRIVKREKYIFSLCSQHWHVSQSFKRKTLWTFQLLVLSRRGILILKTFKPSMFQKIETYESPLSLTIHHVVRWTNSSLKKLVLHSSIHAVLKATAELLHGGISGGLVGHTGIPKSSGKWFTDVNCNSTHIFLEQSITTFFIKIKRHSTENHHQGI